jgi:dTDP-4-dehydrorhamnose reductase
MTWVITGAGGLLGVELARRLRRDGVAPYTPSHRELDVRDEAALARAFARHRPRVVVNCAAWLDVERAERDEAAALAVNGRAPGVLARLCADHDAVLVHVSTNYVFDGTASAPYSEDAATSPVNAYGRTKRAGEEAVRRLHPDGGYVVRTAWLHGTAGRDFARTMIRLAAERDRVEVIDDLYGQPTSAAEVADRIVALVAARPPAGVYHAANAGQATWFDYAREIFGLLGADPRRVRPIPVAAYPGSAPHPRYTVLGQSRWVEAGLAPMRDWRAALRAVWPALLQTATTHAKGITT